MIKLTLNIEGRKVNALVIPVQQPVFVPIGEGSDYIIIDEKTREHLGTGKILIHRPEQDNPMKHTEE